MRLKSLERGNILLSTGENRTRKFNGMQIMKRFEGKHAIANAQKFDFEVIWLLGRAR
jgi:hypothetical protein